MLKQKLNIDTFMIPQLNTKRALEMDTSSDSEESHINKWRRLLVIHGTSEAFSLVKLNPFVIEKGLDYLAGRRAPMRNIRSEDLLICCVPQCWKTDQLQVSHIVVWILKKKKWYDVDIFLTQFIRIYYRLLQYKGLHR